MCVCSFLFKRDVGWLSPGLHQQDQLPWPLLPRSPSRQGSWGLSCTLGPLLPAFSYLAVAIKHAGFLLYPDRHLPPVSLLHLQIDVCSLEDWTSQAILTLATQHNHLEIRDYTHVWILSLSTQCKYSRVGAGVVGLKPELLEDDSIAAGGLTWCATMLAPFLLCAPISPCVSAFKYMYIYKE